MCLLGSPRLANGLQLQSRDFRAGHTSKEQGGLNSGRARLRQRRGGGEQGWTSSSKLATPEAGPSIPPIRSRGGTLLLALGRRNPSSSVHEKKKSSNLNSSPASDRRSSEEGYPINNREGKKGVSPPIQWKTREGGPSGGARNGWKRGGKAPPPSSPPALRTGGGRSR